MNEKVFVDKFDTKEAQNNVKKLRSLIKELKDEMLGLEAGSKQFNELAHLAGELEHRIKEVLETVRGASSDFGDLLGNVTKVGAGVTGAFQSAKAAMSLLGGETEEVTKAIQQMQNLMAMTQGLAAIDQQIKSLKKLSAAIQGTSTAAKILKTILQPKVFLAITAAITALVLIWQKFGDKIQDSIPGLKKAIEYFNGLKKAADDATEAAENNAKKVATAHQQLEEFLKKLKINQLNDEARKSYQKLSDQIEEYKLRLNEVVEQQQKPGIKADEWNELNNIGKEYLETITNLQKAQNDLLNDDKSYIQQLKEKTKAVKEEKAVKDSFYEEAYAEIEYNKAINDQYAKSKEAIEDEIYIQEQEIQTLEKGSVAWYNLAKKIEENRKALTEIDEPLDETQLKLNELELQLLKVDFSHISGGIFGNDIAYWNEVIRLETEKLNLMEAETEEWYNQLIAIEGYKLKLAEAKNESADLGTQLQRAQQVGQMAFSAMGDTLNAFADMQDKTTREGFEKQKKLQIAATTMNMLGGVLSAWTSAMNPANAWMTIWGQIAAGTAQTIATVAMGAALIQLIKQQTFDGGGSSSSRTPSLSSGAMNFTAPVQYSQELNSANINESIQDQRVILLESDVKSTSTRVSVLETENKY